jgi:hypothetical protein
VIIRFSSIQPSNIGGVTATRALTSACSNRGILCTGAVATCTFSGTTTFESLTPCTNVGGALYATVSASLIVEGNLVIQDVVSGYAIRVDVGATNSVFNLKSFLAQGVVAGIFSAQNGAAGSGNVNFTVTADNTLIQGNVGNSDLFLSSLTTTKGISFVFAGTIIQILHNRIRSSIFYISNAAFHPLGLPQVLLSASNMVDISHNYVGEQLIMMNAFGYLLVNSSEQGNVTISNNTMYTASKHMLSISTSSRVQWQCKNLTVSSNQLSNAWSHFYIAMGTGMQSSFNVSGWAIGQGNIITNVKPYFLLVDGTGTTSSVSVNINNSYFSGFHGVIHATPNSASASFAATFQGDLTVVNNTGNWAFRMLQSNALGPRATLNIMGASYTFAYNSFGLISSAGNSDVIFANSSSGVVSNNTLSVASMNYFQAAAATATLQFNGTNLIVQNNGHPPSGSASLFRYTIGLNPALASCFYFSGLVFAETAVSSATLSFISLDGSAGNFSWGGNHFVARGFNSYIFYSALTSTARLNNATFNGYFEISNRAAAAVPAIYMSQAASTGNIQLQLAGFYNFTGNVATSIPVMNLFTSNLIVYMAGIGGLFDSNRATGTGTQVLINVASGSLLVFTQSVSAVQESMGSLLQQYPSLSLPSTTLAQSSTHAFRNNTATSMTTCLSGTVQFHVGGSTSCTSNQTAQISCSASTSSVCIAPTPSPSPPPTPSPTQSPTPQPTPSPTPQPTPTQQQQCSPGQYLSLDMPSACSSCPAGTFSNVTDSSTCHPCPSGTFSSESGSTACTKCSVGQQSTNPTLA